MLRKFFILFGFSIAMAFVEAAVVVYLRQLYYPEGFAFPLTMMPKNILSIELAREFSTIAMLAIVSTIAGRNFIQRFSYFLFCFGVWDIFYYLWLKLLTGWPGSLLTWDILFLIPVPWVGPVLAPILVSLTIVTIAVVTIYKIERGFSFRISILDWLLGALGALFIFISFTWGSSKAINQKVPSTYQWRLLVVGELIAIGAFSHILRRIRRL